MESKLYELFVEIRFSFNSLESLEKLLHLNNETIAQLWSLWALKNKFQLNCKMSKK